MKQIGRLWPCLLILSVTMPSAQSQEIVTFSMYDEFSEIMHNNPGRIVLNGRNGELTIDETDQAGVDLKKFRYRTDTYESAYKQGQEALSSYRKKQYQKKVWKFRPLEEGKQTIIKVEDPQIPGLQSPAASAAVQQPAPQSGATGSGVYPGWNSPWMMSPASPYLSPGYTSPGLMAPMMTPMYPMPGMMSPGFTMPWLPYR